MTDLKTESQHGLIEDNTINRGELDVHELLFKIQEASFIGLDYLEIETIERALIALALLNGAREVPSLSAAINFLQSTGEQRDESNVMLSGRGEVSQGIFISPPIVVETVAALQESSKVLSRVPGQQALSRRALQASADIESFLV